MNTRAELKVWVLASPLDRHESSEALAALRALWPGTVAQEDDPSEADIALFATGGVEGTYIAGAEARRLPPLLIAVPGRNGFAAAVEVVAWSKLHGRPALLQALAPHPSFHLACAAAQGVRALRGTCVSLIGETAPWLVASQPDRREMIQRWGVRCDETPWENFDLDDSAPSAGSTWSQYPRDGVSAAALEAAEALRDHLLMWARRRRPDALAIACFDLLQSHQVSGCLALADLNGQGIPSACEGDLLAALGMLMMRRLGLEEPVWMANAVAHDGATLRLAHCTVAPSLVQDIVLRPHAESASSAAVSGRFPAGQPVTVFRLSADLRRAMVVEGQLEEAAAPVGCRTHALVRCAQPLDALLGNHHLLLRGHHLAALTPFVQLLGLEDIMAPSRR